MKTLFIVIAFCLCTTSAVGADPARCECKHVTGQCTAKLAMAGKRITVESDVPGCSRVTWSANGQARTTVITASGMATEDWHGQSTGVLLDVISCQVCVDDILARNPGMDMSLFDEGVVGSWQCRSSAQFTDGSDMSSQSTLILVPTDGESYVFLARVSGIFVQSNGERVPYKDTIRGSAELDGKQLDFRIENLTRTMKGESRQLPPISLDLTVSNRRMVRSHPSEHPEVTGHSFTCTR